MTPASSPVSGRLAYLDWLRFLVVLLLAPFHAAISFTGMGSVYVYDIPVRNILMAGSTPSGVGPILLTEFSVFLDNWFMHLLFLVSGIGMVFSLRKRTGGQFMGERCNRLLLPLLIGTLLVVPFQSWLGALSFRRYSGSLLGFFPAFFTRYFNYGHFWFLVYLFVFSTFLLPLFLSIQRQGEASRLVSTARRFAGMPWIFLPALWTGLLEALFRPGWPGSMDLVNDWAYVTVFLTFFFIGFMAGSAPELLEAFETHRWAALSLGLAAFACRIAVYAVVPVPAGYNAANILTHAFRGLAAYGLVMAAMGFARRHLNRRGRLLGIARDLSFPLYVLHFAPLTLATYLLLDSGLGVWTRWILAVAASWGFVALFTFLARFVPGVRDFFGIRKPASGTP